MVKRVYSAVCKAEAILAAMLLVIMVLLITLGGLARMAAAPLVWTTDFATCAFAWACFLAANVAWRNDALMSVRFVPDRLSRRNQRTLELVNYAIISIFLGYVIVAGLWLSWVGRARSFQGIPEISYSWVTLSLPVGGMLLFITTLVKAHAVWRSAPSCEVVSDQETNV